MPIFMGMTERSCWRDILLQKLPDCSDLRLLAQCSIVADMTAFKDISEKEYRDFLKEGAA